MSVLSNLILSHQASLNQFQADRKNPTSERFFNLPKAAHGRRLAEAEIRFHADIFRLVHFSSHQIVPGRLYRRENRGSLVHAPVRERTTERWTFTVPGSENLNTRRSTLN